LSILYATTFTTVDIKFHATFKERLSPSYPFPLVRGKGDIPSNTGVYIKLFKSPARGLKIDSGAATTYSAL